MIRYSNLARCGKPGVMHENQQIGRTVAIKPSRQFEKKKPTSTEKQLEIAKIRKLNADTAKEVQETQAAVFSMYSPNKASKGQ